MLFPRYKEIIRMLKENGELNSSEIRSSLKEDISQNVFDWTMHSLKRKNLAVPVIDDKERRSGSFRGVRQKYKLTKNADENFKILMEKY